MEQDCYAWGTEPTVIADPLVTAILLAAASAAVA